MSAAICSLDTTPGKDKLLGASSSFIFWLLDPSSLMSILSSHSICAFIIKFNKKGLEEFSFYEVIHPLKDSAIS